MVKYEVYLPTRVGCFAGQQGTTLLQMQIGLSRLILGAGYRSMKGAYAADHFTHEKDLTLPYTFEALTDFTEAV